jgi:hypothetical protein
VTPEQRIEEDVVQRIAVTGHVGLSDDVARWVTAALTERLGGPLGVRLHGVTCLAKGADQIFAAVVLALSGTLDVVLPAQDYAREMDRTDAADTFRDLLGRARSVRTMPFPRSSREAYLAASEAMLDECDLLLAVWDGRKSRAVGDTADVVAKARARALPVEVLWPPSPLLWPPELSPPDAATPAEAPGPG